MAGCSIFEFDALAPESGNAVARDDLHIVPDAVFAWLEDECLRVAESGEAAWLRWSRRAGHRAIQVTSYAGVIQAPGGFQIEVLPKIGRALAGGASAARELLLDMLCCMESFPHVETGPAKLMAARMPLMEVFIGEFLRSVAVLVRHGLSSDYRIEEGPLPALRGRLLMARHLAQSVLRPDRFFTAHDEFSVNRPENRLLRSAVRAVLPVTAYQEHQQLGRELEFALADIPPSLDPAGDLLQVRIDRNMGRYRRAIDWAALILSGLAPLTGRGLHEATSLMFPMQALFEGLVAQHLRQQLAPGMRLKSQVRSEHFVRHRKADWFQLRPDLLVSSKARPEMVLDTKWKLINQGGFNSKEKYELSQSDFYQLYAYGRAYLDRTGDLALIYPKTERFDTALEVFEFPRDADLRLWVLPFCLKDKKILLPSGVSLDRIFAV